ncbi:hypothetical protein [Nocardia sp. NPDC003963]
MSPGIRELALPPDIPVVVVRAPGNPLLEARFVVAVGEWPPICADTAYDAAVAMIADFSPPGDWTASSGARGASLSTSCDGELLIVSATCIPDSTGSVLDAAARVFDRVRGFGAAGDRSRTGTAPESADPGEIRCALDIPGAADGYARTRRAVIAQALDSGTFPASAPGPRTHSRITQFVVIGGDIKE